MTAKGERYVLFLGQNNFLKMSRVVTHQYFKIFFVYSLHSFIEVAVFREPAAPPVFNAYKGNLFAIAF